MASRTEDLTPPENTVPCLTCKQVTKSFGSGPDRVVVLKDVTFKLGSGTVSALVGQSGSGKSTLGNIIAGITPPDSGMIALQGAPLGATRSPAQRKRIQIVFQDPFGSLNPVHTVAHHLTRPLLRHRIVRPHQVTTHIHNLLERVGLTPPAVFARRYPYALSGGERQRVAIARALAVEPELLILDEPTSMLDVSIRKSILGLLSTLKVEHSLTYLLITHDFSTAEQIADDIMVLDRGRIVERAPTQVLIQSPAHDYSQQLIAAVPKGDGSLFRRHSHGASHD